MASIPRMLCLVVSFPILFLLSGCIDRSVIITGCEAAADKTPLCGWQRPEDMELLPDGKTLIVSEMAKGHGEVPGALSLLDTISGSKQALPMAVANKEFWGESGCRRPVDKIAPHGIHLSTRADGRLQLLVVNHGERESVEMYEVHTPEHRLTWRGCAQPPQGSFLNDVVALPEGGFVTTHMYTKGDAAVGTMSFEEVKALLGFNPGYLLMWNGQSFRRLGDFSGNYPNGVQISPDGRFLFVNLWAESLVKKVDRQSGEVIGEAQVSHPDNSQWDGDGKLLVTGHDFSINDLLVCPGLEEGTCPGDFEVVELDAHSMQTRPLRRIGGAPMGAGTVTQRVGDTWYIGSFLGDRVLMLPAPNQ